MHLDPQTRAAVVTLFGTILYDTADGRLCLNVQPGKGDADRFRLAGELWLKRAQCHEVIESGAGRLDVVRISYVLAVAISNVEASRRMRSHWWQRNSPRRNSKSS